MTDQQSQMDYWDRNGHRYRIGFIRDGYAVCVECDAHENDDEILQQCPESKGGKRIEAETARADRLSTRLTQEHKHIAEIKKLIFDALTGVRDGSIYRLEDLVGLTPEQRGTSHVKTQDYITALKKVLANERDRAETAEKNFWAEKARADDADSQAKRAERRMRMAERAAARADKAETALVDWQRESAAFQTRIAELERIPDRIAAAATGYTDERAEWHRELAKVVRRYIEGEVSDD